MEVDRPTVFDGLQPKSDGPQPALLLFTELQLVDTVLQAPRAPASIHRLLFLSIWVQPHNDCDVTHNDGTNPTQLTRSPAALLEAFALLQTLLQLGQLLGVQFPAGQIWFLLVGAGPTS